jgi:tetratricopeptide (TPR) repeat protein
MNYLRTRRVGFGMMAALFLILSPWPVGDGVYGQAADQGFVPPYQLTIVLDVAKSRVLTDVFRQQVERELQEGLQAALGDLARVTVEFDHPKLADIHANGLGRALDNWKVRSPVKTHFVCIDLINNQYEIRARQYDGPTGTASPVVHSDRTPDRAFVARAAALLIERDFGFTAKFSSWPKATDVKVQPQIVRLDLLGAGLGVSLSRFVKKNDVFAVVQMFRDGRAELVPWALVQVNEAPNDETPDAACTGKLFWRYKPPAEGSDHDGYRCVKLGAVSGPVRLRLFQQKTDRIAGPLQATLEVRRLGFKEEAAGLLTGSPDSLTGIFTTASMPSVEPFDRVAFVTVKIGGQPRAYVPIPILGDETVAVPMSTVAEQIDTISQRIERWQRHVDDAWLVHVEVFTDLRNLGQKIGTPRETLVTRAEAGLKRTIEDYNRLNTEKEGLIREAGAGRPEIKRLEQRLADLKEGEGFLSKFIDDQNKVINEDAKPERKAAKNQIIDAGIAEEKNDYQQAIDLYTNALKVIDDPKVKEHLEQLEAQWMLKDMDHARARKFIYETWPGLDTAGLEREMENARKALDECKKANDKLSPRKFIQATNSHFARIKQEKDGLKPDTRPDDEKPAQRIATVLPKLIELSSDAIEWVKTSSK